MRRNCVRLRVVISAVAAVVLVTQPVFAAPRTHEPCDVNPAMEQLCTAVVQGDLRYTCFGSNAIEPLLQTSPLPHGLTLYTWTLKVVGYHECPDRLGDWVRVTGVLTYEFDGAPGKPSRCGGFQWCTTETFGWWDSLTRTVLVTVETVTSSTDAASGTAIDTEQYLL